MWCEFQTPKLLEYWTILRGGVNQYCYFLIIKTTFNLLINTHDQQKQIEHKSIVEAQLGKPPILPITAKVYLQIVFSCYYRQGW